MATEFEQTVLLRLGQLHEGQEALRRELLGNGQPGRIQRIEKTQADQGNELEKQGDIIKSARTRMSLLAAIISFAITLGAMFLDNLWTEYQQRHSAQKFVDQQATSSKQN